MLTKDPNDLPQRKCPTCRREYHPQRPWHGLCPRCWRARLKADAHGVSHFYMPHLEQCRIVCKRPLNEIVVEFESCGRTVRGTLADYSVEEARTLLAWALRKEREAAAIRSHANFRRIHMRAVPDPDDDPDPPMAA